ncbi:MAG: MarR family transcriptional regulator [Sandaracinus sp.]|nr:MarR family transcriptional regulator [Sandaracinus sp.]MCB9635554.1 MarR family transcriptional regulator [Sandaracinus sp.]
MRNGNTTEEETHRPSEAALTPVADVDRILETLVYLYTESRRVTKELARQHGLTGPQVTAIKVLENFGALSLTDLSARMSATNSTMTGIADRMERDGLVERTRSETDRRVVQIALTEKGRQLAAQIPIASMALFAEALRSLDERDRRDLTRILRKLTDEVAELVRKDD